MKSITNKGNPDDNRDNSLVDLQKQVKLMETLIDTIFFPVFCKNEKGVFIVCNNAFANYLGLPKERIIGSTVFDIAPRELAEIYHQADIDLMASKGKQVYEAKVKTGEDTYNDVIFYKSHLFSQDDSINGLVGVIVDITERKRAEAELQRTKVQLENAVAWKNAVFAASTVGVLAVTPERFIVEVNPKFIEMCGYSQEELIGQSVSLIHVSDETYKLFEEIAYSQIKVKKIVKIEYEFRRKDGVLFWTEISGRAVDDGDQSKGFIWVLVDITERKLREKEIEEVKTVLEAAFEQNPAPMIMASYPDKLIRIINTSCADFLEIENMFLKYKMTAFDDMLLQCRQDVKAYNSKGELLETDNHPLTLAMNGAYVKDEELKIIIGDGRIKWSLASSTPIYNRQNELIAAMMVFPDITVRKNIENELEQKNRLLLESNRILYEKSVNDSLTNIYNHQFIINSLISMIEYARRYNDKLSIIMADIDYFKHVNDKYGHQVGDQVIIGVAETICNSLRKVDLTGRYGGEEFLIILPKTDLAASVKVAEKIRRNISRKTYTDQNLVIALSLGAAEYEGEDSTALIKKADECLYRAKRNGRNRTES